ncbi:MULTISPECIES: AAA family ATPase [unclassified Saccharibacter]|uniref:AAA family ATPase n=1 Tax=unclassified Saccharibacter TaxID=2648722 RepID=UPI00132479C4|nr:MULTISPECIES: AAA family ATPase [unclassified Saccharibacter]MXV35578.1 AAA domain-containing protein [Saccharibacter sp. EH611]MXV58877.1 AAA domain-containing protein [Saccharibacter sp. EH70]MXV65533.1 AAA domain-containing protein [Saccharibacter sp. EH60]
MLTSLIPRLSKAMPLMMVTFLLLLALQLSLMLHLSWHLLAHWVAALLDAGRPLYLPLGVVTFALTLLGVFYDRSSDRLLQRGLQRRKTLTTSFLTLFTHRRHLEEIMVRDQHESSLNAEELATSLRARVIGQDAICTDIAQQLRRRLALRVHDKPVGIFLFAGPAGNGKKYLAKQLSRHMDRPLLTLDVTDLSSPYALSLLWGAPNTPTGAATPGLLTRQVKAHPTSIIVLEDIEKAHSAVLKKLLTAWNDGALQDNATHETLSIKRCIFILTSTVAAQDLSHCAELSTSDTERRRGDAVALLRRADFPADILNRLDRLFLFRPLSDRDMARVAALEMEQMVEGYGLHLPPGGIDPTPLQRVITLNKERHVISTVRDLLRFVEDMISDGLIAAQQQGKRRVKLTFHDGRIIVESDDTHDTRLSQTSL